MNTISKTLAIITLALTATAASATIKLPAHMSIGEEAFWTYSDGSSNRELAYNNRIWDIGVAERRILARLLVNGTVKNTIYDAKIARIEDNLKNSGLSDEKLEAFLCQRKEVIALEMCESLCYSQKQVKTVETLLRAHQAEVLEELRELRAEWLFKYIVIAERNRKACQNRIEQNLK